jgi:4-fold beta-flower domain-containing protein
MPAPTPLVRTRPSLQLPAGSPAQRPATIGAATAEPVFDHAGLVCAWMLPGRLVGPAGGTQAWLIDGALYSRAGTHIGVLHSGLFCGTDGLVSGFLSDALGPPSLPPQESTPPAPSFVPPAPRPKWKPRLVPVPPRDEWATYGWSGFLIAAGRPAVSPERARPRIHAGTSR